MIAAPPVSGPAAFRARFPMLERTVHLASCSLGARSTELDASLHRMLEAMTEHGAPWWLFEEQVDEARRRFAALIGARPEQVAVVPNVSTGAYQIASATDWAERPEIVTTDLEFPSVAHVWLAQEPLGATVRYVGERDGCVEAEGYAAAIGPRTGLVSVPLVAYRSGARLPVREVAAAAHAAGARVVVDAYQAVGVEPVDVTELDCDYLLSGTLKYLLGLPGVAFLYARSPLAEVRDPQLTGWFGREDPFAFDPRRLDFAGDARRFETGTPAIPALYAANASLALFNELDLPAVRRHVSGLVSRATGRLAEQGARIDGPLEAARRGAHVALVEPEADAMARWLAERRIVIAPRGDVARLSFHYYNTAADVDAACEQIERYRAGRSRRSATAAAPAVAEPPASAAASLRALERWLPTMDAAAFPFDAVLDRYHAVGKHHVEPALLEVLASVRAVMPRLVGPAAAVRALDAFLDTALDKRDGRYDYPSYLALGVLPMPAGDDAAGDTTAAERQRDRLVVQLVVDVLRFELAASEGGASLLPELRPDARTVSKRFRLGLAAIQPALRRLLPELGPLPDDPEAAARRVCAEVDADTSPAERLAVRLSVLPVDVVHDEWMFIRVLQSFETTFALLAVELRAAVAALLDGRPAVAQRRIVAADQALHEAAPLFSLLGTMQVEAFRRFRTHTEGASAIQSRGYKTVESLCRQPDGERLDSIAYLSVPEVRERVLAGQATLDDALRSARAAGCLTANDAEGIEQAMRRFAATLLHWRRTHYRLAVRMLGERTGTGYTEGTPYLAAARSIPVFRSLDEENQHGA